MWRLWKLVLVDGLSFSGFERDKLYMNSGGGAFRDISDVSGLDSPTDGRGVVAADFDNDGDTDLLVTNLQPGKLKLFRNDRGANSRWLRLILQGTRSNRDAVGAVVKARLPSSAGATRAAPQVVARTVHCGSGFLSSSDKRLLLGLGDADAVPELEVRWPSGLVQRFRDLQTDQTLRIIEGDDEPRIVDLPSFELRGDALDAGSGLLAVRRPLADLGLSTLDGGASLGAREMAGRWNLVNFWSPSCAPCLTEMPRLERLWRSHDGRVGVVGVALVDASRRDDVLAIRKRLGISYPIGLADEQLPERLFPDRESIAIPTTYLVDPQGKVAGVYEGLSDLEALEADLERVLR